MKKIKPDEVFKDKIADETKSAVKVLDDTVKKADIADEALVGKPTEPLYQKKVYAIDLKSIGIKVEGKELIVDVMEVKDGKAKIECGQVKCEVPKEFLF